MGRIVHFEIPVEDTRKAREFYSEVFGWNFAAFGDDSYLLATTGPDNKPGINGAITKKRAAAQPLTNSIDVANIDEAMKKVEEKGGFVVVPKTVLPGVGYMAYFKDLDGNIMGLWQQDTTAK